MFGCGRTLCANHSGIRNRDLAFIFVFVLFVFLQHVMQEPWDGKQHCAEDCYPIERNE